MSKVNTILGWLAAVAIVFMLTTTAKDYVQVEKSKLSRRDTTIVIHDSIQVPAPQIVFKYVKVTKRDSVFVTVKDTTQKVYKVWGDAIDAEQDTVTLTYNSYGRIPPGWFSDVVVKPRPQWTHMDKLYIQVPEYIKEPHDNTWDYVWFGVGVLVGAEGYHLLTK